MASHGRTGIAAVLLGSVMALEAFFASSAASHPETNTGKETRKSFQFRTDSLLLEVQVNDGIFSLADGVDS